VPEAEAKGCEKLLQGKNSLVSHLMMSVSMLWKRFKLLQKFSSVSRHAGNLCELEASVKRKMYERGILKEDDDRLSPYSLDYHVVSIILTAWCDLKQNQP
jgi:hypothetical protein